MSPFRLDEYRAKIQFITSAPMPNMIYRAAEATGKVSNTQYIQHVLCEALARDLGLDAEEIKAQLPPPKGSAAFLHDGTRHSQPRITAPKAE